MPKKPQDLPIFEPVALLMSVQKLGISTLFLLILSSISLPGQDIANFTQFFFNPYSLNPSFAGTEGKGAFFAAYRQQWAGVEGAPTIMNFSYHSPLKSGMALGFNVANDKRGLLANTGALMSGSYALALDEGKYIRFGLSVGAAWNTVDLDQLQSLGADPAITNLLNKNTALIGNAGLSAHIKSFHIGVAMPQLFSPAYVSDNSFTIEEVRPFQALVLHASNRFYLQRDKIVLEPYAVYRINTGLPSQFEVAGVVHLNHLVWLGASYKQELGISGLGGIRLNEQIAVGASYTLKSGDANALPFPGFEVQLSYLTGSTIKKSHYKHHTNPHHGHHVTYHTPAAIYSFVDTKKTHYKTPAQLAAEKKKQEEDLKKKQEEQRLAAEAAKKKEQERLQAEARKKAERERLAAIAKAKADSVAKAEEALRLQRLEEHKDDPDAQHNDHPEAHPDAERHEYVKRIETKIDLNLGHYVIVGVFGAETNASRFAQGLRNAGFKAEYGHLTVKNLWYVHVYRGTDIEATRAERDKFRRMKMTRDAWLLTVEE